MSGRPSGKRHHTYSWTPPAKPRPVVDLVAVLDLTPQMTLLSDGSWLARTPDGHPWAIGVFGPTQEAAQRMFAVAVARRATLLTEQETT